MSAPVPALSDEAPSVPLPDREQRLAAMAAENFHFIWRSLRRLGVPLPHVDDAAQQVFEVAARRLGTVEVGRERAFLFKTALFVAAEAQRNAARRRARDGGDAVDELGDGGPNPEEATDRSRKRALLDAVLERMPVDERAVFVLFELEELTMAEIARLLELPPGTVASRLRRARETFHREAKRLRSGAGLRGVL
ncbi:MAG TPA: sigma-70 family RNA polymerase sigma factor [Polyangiaceae bacterium]